MKTQTKAMKVLFSFTLYGRAIISSSELIFVFSHVTCWGINPSSQSLGSSEYPNLQPNKAPVTTALHVACPPCITSSVIAVLLISNQRPFKIVIILILITRIYSFHMLRETNIPNKQKVLENPNWQEADHQAIQTAHTRS